METIQCPICVGLMAPVRAIEESEFPMSGDAETATFVCQNGHSIPYADIEVLLTQTQAAENLQAEEKTEEPAAKNKSKGQKKAEKKSHTRESKAVEPDEVPSAVSEGAGGEIDNAPAAPAVSRKAISERANGDLECAVLLREFYADSCIEYARDSGQTLQEWLQERIDFWMENEFAMAPKPV